MVAVPSSPLVDAGAPQWAVRLVQRLQAAFQPHVPVSPSYLAAFASTSLPDPDAWRQAVIYVPDKGCVAVSTGAAWVRADGGAL